jgi:cytochrome c-type biogenesis protein CcmH
MYPTNKQVQRIKEVKPQSEPVRVPHASFLRYGFTGLLLAAVIVLTTSAADTNAAQSTRFDKLGHQMMCTCSCAQVLLECNHVGCPNSEGMRRELMAGVVDGDSDTTIFDAFVAKYGPTVLAAPTTKGFNLVAWIMPFAVLLAGIGGTALLIRRWKLRTVPMPSPSLNPNFPEIRNRIRRDTEL